MRTLSGKLDSIPVLIYVPETLNEFHSGVRSFGSLQENAIMLFNFGYSTNLMFENSNVSQDLALLFFFKFTNSGIVQEIKYLHANSDLEVSSNNAWPVAAEVPMEFCRQYNINVGSTLTLDHPLTKS